MSVYSLILYFSISYTLWISFLFSLICSLISLIQTGFFCIGCGSCCCECHCHDSDGHYKDKTCHSGKLCHWMLYYATLLLCYYGLHWSGSFKWYNYIVILCSSMLYYTPKFDIMIPKIMQWSSMWCHSSHLITLSTTSFLFYSNFFLFDKQYVCLNFLFY